MLPTWAVVIILGIVTGIGGFLVKYLMSSSRELGAIHQAFVDRDRRQDELSGRVGDLEHWKVNLEAELVAYRNGYRERPRWSIR
jgi:hypothetical protein